MFSRLSSSTLKKICGAGCAVTTIYAGTSYGASVAFASSSHAALKFVSKARMIPHPSKANRKYVLPPHGGGEDAYFIDDSLNCVGVADGVGGWALHGVDAGIFARQLMVISSRTLNSNSKHKHTIGPAKTTIIPPRKKKIVQKH